jgi:hypothetical protein
MELYYNQDFYIFSSASDKTNSLVYIFYVVAHINIK